jgi:hypothetical protein
MQCDASIVKRSVALGDGAGMAPARRFSPCVMTHRIATLPAASGSQTTTGTPRPVQTRPSAIKHNVTGEGITIRHYDLWWFSCEIPDAPIMQQLTPTVKTGGRVHSLRRGQIYIAPAALSVSHQPRFPALPLFGRRPRERVDGLGIPASENLHGKTH